jgi:hypothetical protein
MFEDLRTRLELMEIMNDARVQEALHTGGNAPSGAAQAGQRAGLVMKFARYAAGSAWMPPVGLSPKQRAIWLAHAFSGAVVPHCPTPGIAAPLRAAARSYAQRHRETSIAGQAEKHADRLMRHEVQNGATATEVRPLPSRN